MKKQSVEFRSERAERIEEMSRRWRAFSLLSIAVVTACALLGGLAGWVLVALRLGLFPGMNGC